MTVNKQHLKIVNFGLENLEMLLDLKIISFPVQIFKLSDNIAIIHDERIPLRFYWNKYCTHCCPNHLLPLPQRAYHDLKVRTGDIKHFEGGTSMIVGKDEYEGSGVEHLRMGTLQELQENHKLRKQAYLKPFVDYYKRKYE
jgi:hypothetical protein